MELNLDKVTKGNKKSWYSYSIDKRQIREKSWALSEKKKKKKETTRDCLLGIWKRSRHSWTFLPKSSTANSLATLPKLERTKADTGRRKNCPLQKIETT